MLEKLWFALLPYAGRYAYDEGKKDYKWYDKIAYWIVLRIK